MRMIPADVFTSAAELSLLFLVVYKTYDFLLFKTLIYTDFFFLLLGWANGINLFICVNPCP